MITGSRDPAVLLVSSDADQVRALQALLESLSVDVVVASSGEEALRRVLRRDHAAVVINLELSGIDGYETARLLRLRTRTAVTPIVFLSGLELAEEEQERAYHLGATDLICGRFRPTVLLSKLRAFVAAARTVQAARAADSARAEFMSLAAHELRGPLGVSYGYVAMLQDGTFGDVPAGWERPLEIVIHKLDELNELVDDLFLTARMDSGQVATHTRSVDLGVETQRALSRAEGRAQLLGAELRFSAPVARVRAMADPAHLAKILDNLINNAFKYTTERPRLSIEVSSPGRPTVTVTDQGAGVPEGMREHIFERAIRYIHPDLKSVPGTGLGLYMSRMLAQQQGGELTLEDTTLGEGCRFALTLPADKLGLRGANLASTT